MADYKIIVGGRTVIVNLDTGATVASVLLNGQSKRIAEGAYYLSTQIPVASLPSSGGGKTYLDLTLIAAIPLPTAVFGVTAQVSGFVTLGVTCDPDARCLVWVSTIPPPNIGASPNSVPPGLCGGSEGGNGAPTAQGILTQPASAITPVLYVFGLGIDSSATNVNISISAVLKSA